MLLLIDYGLIQVLFKQHEPVTVCRKEAKRRFEILVGNLRSDVFTLQIVDMTNALRIKITDELCNYDKLPEDLR